MIAPLLALLLALPGASAASVDVEADRSPEACAGANGPTLFGDCPVHWVDAGTPEFADDEVSLHLEIERVRVASDAPGLPGTVGAALDPSEIAVRHPVYRTLNDTWPTLDAAVPEPIHPYLTFDRRPLMYHDGPSTEWGVFITFHSPEKLPVGREGRHFNLFAVCWDFCEWDDSPIVRSNEDEIRPLVNDVYLAESSTDAFLDQRAWEARHCSYGTAGFTTLHCPVPAAAATSLGVAVAGAKAVSPNLRVGLLVNRTEVRLGETSPPPLGPPPPEPGPPLSAANAPPGSSPAESRLVGPVRLEPLGVDAEGARPSEDRPLAPPDPPRVASVAGDAPGRTVGTWVVLAAASLAASLLLALSLYHRIARRSALEQTTRQRVFEAIAAEPGIRVGTLARALALDYTTVRHHVRLLAAFGLVAKGPDAGQPRWYASGRVPPSAASTARLLSAPSVRAVRDLLAARGALPQAEIARELGFATSTVSEAVARLAAAGVVTAERKLDGVRVRPA